MNAIKRRGALAVLLSFVFLLAVVVVPSGTASADPIEDLEFTAAATSGRPGYFVPITSSDPCPVTPDVTTVAKIYFQDSSHQTFITTVPVDQTTGEWYPGFSFRVYEVVPQGKGWFYAYCWAAGDITGIYKEYPYWIEGVPAQYEAPTQIARGDQLVIESVDTCRNGNYSVQATLRLIGAYHQHSLGYPDIQGDYSWEIDQEIPMGVPLGSYMIHIQCESDPEIFYEQRVIEIIDTPVYMTLGDSYSSGTGTFNYYSTSGNCRRSEDGYPLYVADELDLGTPLFAACHGAQTADFYNQNPNTGESAQISHLSENTEVVTLTIGGNDAGFKGVLERCVNSPANSGWGCSTDTAFTADLADHLDALAGGSPALAADGRPIYSLENLYKDIATAAPNAKIYVGGYPRLFGSDVANYTANSNAPGGAQCAIPIGATVSYDDAQWLNQKANELNGITFDAVQAAQNDGVDITFVSAVLFTGHGQCDSQGEWIHPVIFGSSFNDPLPESLHPTSGGYANGYGIAFVAAMN